MKHFRFKTTGKQRIHVTPSRWQVASSTFVATVHPSSVLRSRQRATDLDTFARDLTVAAAALAQ